MNGPNVPEGMVESEFAVISLGQAGGLLGVTMSRVKEMVACGDLQGGVGYDGTWYVFRYSLDRYRKREAEGWA